MSKKTRKLEDIVASENKLRIEKELALNKAFNSSNVDEIYKAKAYLESQNKKDDFGGKTMLVDPQSQYINGGYREKPLQMSFQMLRGMGDTDIIKAIRTTRKSQISNFLVPQKDKYSTGFIIQKKKKNIQNQTEKKLTKEEEAKIELEYNQTLEKLHQLQTNK